MPANTRTERPVLEGPNDVAIGVKAAGLNFRDVMNAIGLYPEGPMPFGGECTGVITEVGDAVTDLKVGDEPIGFVVWLPPGSQFFRRIRCHGTS